MSFLSILDARPAPQPPKPTRSCRTAWFGELLVEYDDGVLSPRSWTQLQSDWAVELLDRLDAGRVLELCAGAGHIGLLTALRSGRSLVQVESDEAAANYARRNAHRAGMSRRVFVRCGEMTAVLGDSEQFTLVLADPPYLTDDEAKQYPEDPPAAIAGGGADGLDAAKQTLRITADHLAPRGACLLQLRDEAQADALATWLEREGLNLKRCDQRFIERGGVVLMRKVVDRW